MATRSQAQFIQRRLARTARGSNVFRLTDQYQRQVTDLTNQYQSSFAEYQQRVQQIMSPYEQEVQRYQTQTRPAFDAAVAGYNQRFQEYLTNLQSVYDNPLEVVPGYQVRIDRNVQRGRERNPTVYVNFGQGWVNRLNLPDGYTYETGNLREPGVLYRVREAPQFSEQMPTAPDAPVSPDVPEFDSGDFDQRRQALQEGFQRDISARRSARITASRRTNRTMLSGVQS
jgi:hypothetical protein